MPTRYLRSPDGGFVPYSGGGGTGGSVTVDETLSVSGAAADAKVAGEKISKLSEAIADKLDASKLPEAVNDALAQAKASGEFDGEDGSDYVLTDADKTEIAGIAAGMVDVPEGGGGSGEKWRKIAELTTEEELKEFRIEVDENGNEFNLRKIWIAAYIKPVAEGVTSNLLLKLNTDKSISRVWDVIDCFGKVPKSTEERSIILNVRELIADGGITIPLSLMSQNYSNLPLINFPYGNGAYGLASFDAELNSHSAKVIDVVHIGSYTTAIGVNSKFLVYGVDA